MALAAFLLTLSCTMAPTAPGVPPHDECDTFEIQRFDNATPDDIALCASMADDLLQLDRFGSRCEVLPMADTGETADIVTLEEWSATTRDNAPVYGDMNRIRYSGNLLQRMYDQPNFRF